jgi:tryptophanyl-tRNA synthetase
MRVLSGMQPSGNVHVGNYFGSMKPNIDLLGADENIYIVVDLHALTTVHDPDELRRYRQDLMMDMLACGFDASKGILFFQSYIPEHAELAWILSCVTPVGLLERSVSYKDKISQGHDANAGLFMYPVLQAADILLYDADVVPVGKDQKQHLEISRDIAQKFNHRYGADTLVVPEAQIRDDVAVVPGTDGKKMSKSYGNTIPLFADDKTTEKIIMGIVTDSKGVEDPKDPETCFVYQIHSLLLDEGKKKALAEKYRAGGLGYGEAKKMLLADFFEYFGAMREKRANIKEKEVEEVIMEGSKKARSIAEKTMGRVRKAVGLL